MNARTTTPTLPSTTERDQAKTIKLLSDAILILYSRDADHERRIRDLEAVQSRGTGKYSTERYIGRHFRFVELTNPHRLALYYSVDGIVWPTEPLTEYNPTE